MDIEVIRDWYVTARNFAKVGDNANKQIVIDNITKVWEYCIRLYDNSTNVIERAKCKVQAENLLDLIKIIEGSGLGDNRVKAFFGFVSSSADAPSFVDIIKGNVSPSPKVGVTEQPKEAIAMPKSQQTPIGNPPVQPPKSENKPIGNWGGGTPVKKPKPVMSFAPQCLDDFIGQTKTVQRLKEELLAARMQGLRYIDNVLLFGNPGLGKTTLMGLIAKELGVKFILLDGTTSTNKGKDKEDMLNEIRDVCLSGEPFVIGIDEIHGLHKDVQSALLTLLGSRRFIYKDDERKSQVVDVKEFTFIAATTDPEKLLPTIKDRCVNLTFYLVDYTREELAQIFVNKFFAFGLTVDEDVLNSCIDRCRSSIREVEAFVKGLKSQAILVGCSNITKEIAQKYFENIGRDAIGLRPQDINVLKILQNEGPMSVDNLAARAHISKESYVSEFEPYLLKIGFVSIGSNGRSLTLKAVDYLNGKPINEVAPKASETVGADNVPNNAPTNPNGDDNAPNVVPGNPGDGVGSLEGASTIPPFGVVPDDVADVPPTDDGNSGGISFGGVTFKFN